MKSERRHELKTNQLADWLGGTIEQMKPYRNAILGVVLLVAVATAGYAWWARKSADREKQAWNGFLNALAEDNLAPGRFEEIIEEYPGTHMAHWAGVLAGDLRLAMGCNGLFQDKAIANQELRGAGDQDGAVDHYLRVLQQSRYPMLRERATFGLARAREALGELDKAKLRYQEVTENWPDGAYTVAAARRLKDLEKTSTKKLYDRFASFNPMADYSKVPGAAGERLPFELDSLPEDGPLFQPKMMMDLQQKGTEDDQPEDVPETSSDPDTTPPEAADTDKTPPEATTPGAAKTDATDADTTDKDATQTDAAETDTAETDEPKPADSKPADSKPADSRPTPDTTE